ncbi:hypothetical protein FE783_12825 [Paenibacillus mesophilus]|uniref:AAA family ATPase n=1 Tax=Paenibacillus mesophilus TaxID=2582849 RepID=UPI00110E242C|nr:hypothetical protein [Paenibacillus mesophilus]TMV49391.1 hypothetical protein FE783_12825 [Paenibacillus mesophilus]
MIKSISFTNVKGQTGTQEFGKKTLIIGPNGSGKTTRVQTLGIAIEGYAPGNGKTAQDTFKLATGDAMVVGLKTDAFQFTRTFTKNESRDKTGKVKVEINQSLAVSPGRGEKKDTDKKARILSEIGSFPVALDFNEFLSLSDAKRRDFFYSLSPITTDGWSKAKIEEWLRESMLLEEVRENNPEQYQATQDIIEEALQEYPDGFGVSEGLQAMLDWATAQRTIWDSKKKDAQGAVRQIADMKNEMDETDRNISDSKNELDSLQQQLIRVEKLISGSTAKKEIVGKRVQRIGELRGNIAQLKAQPVVTDTAGLEKERADLEQQVLEELDVQVLMAPLKDKISAARSQRAVLDEKHQGLRHQVVSISSTVKTLAESLDTVGELGGRCIIHHMISCNKDFTGLDEFVSKKKTEADKAIATLQEELKQVQTEIATLDEQVKSAELERENILSKAQEVSKKNSEIRKRVGDIDKEVADRRTAAQRRENELKLLEDELNRLVNEPADKIEDVQMLQIQSAGVQAQIDELKQKIQEKEKAKQTILLMQQSMLDNRKAEYKAIAFKSLLEQLGPKGIQGELVKEIIGPLKSDIQQNLQFMGIMNEPFFQTESDTGKEVFQFGWINDRGHQVNFDVLSRGQQALYFAAMMMTIIDRAQPKLKLLVIDNINDCDSKNFQLLLDGISRLEDRVDNIVLSGAIEYEFRADGWLVTDLGPAKSDQFAEEEPFDASA